MKHRNTTLRLQFTQRLFQAKRLVERFLDEIFDQWFAPRIQHSASKTAAETTNPGKAHSPDFDRFAIKHFDSGIFKNLSHSLWLAGFKIVVPQHTDHRNPHSRAQVSNQFFGFLGKTVIGQVAAKQEDIRLLRDFAEDIVQ
jgi:hypothetical protein